ncbi:hypothetical protein GC102_24340 [Paenibacillus sp. LMG 31460]|uniref:Copper amine oxidase-like N-terminal domain-containing protein n=1 Tax=Paenibacillus germinis TaxID=2654979 RepID=A0ABX1Z921_9BACL|nr:stalk domain-containing protein [Paenibacillus germinis]NOU88854.1 hypothetical protein [Paenibacillus germinis]
MRKYAIGLFAGLLLSFCTIVSASETVQAYLFPSKIIINGEQKELGPMYEVINYKDSAYVPIRFFSETMEAKVEYLESPRTISVTYEDMYLLDLKIVDEISLSGVKLLQPEDDVISALGTGQSIDGCFGCGLYTYYPEKKLYVITSNNQGDLKNKVVNMITTNKNDNVLGIKIGDSLSAVKSILDQYKFKYDDSLGAFVKGDLILRLIDENHDKIIDQIYFGLNTKSRFIR